MEGSSSSSQGYSVRGCGEGIGEDGDADAGRRDARIAILEGIRTTSGDFKKFEGEIIDV